MPKRTGLAVPCGRLLDRIGAARGLILLLLAAGTATALLVVASRAGAPDSALLALVTVPALVVGGSVLAANVG